MIAEIDAIIQKAVLLEKNSQHLLDKIHPNFKKSASNLLHYQALRTHDLRGLQKKLGYMGLSRFAKSYSHVMVSLLTNRAILQSMLDNAPLQLPDSDLSFKEGAGILNFNAKSLLGYRSKNRSTRIMVTMPTEAADHLGMVKDMIKAGMNCARINCAHDDPETWEKIIANVRQASKVLDKKCKVAMDLAGPKIRTGALVGGPKVLKIRPKKDVYGKIKEPLNVWIGSEPKAGLLHIPILNEDIEKLNRKKELFLSDARNKKRQFVLIKKEIGGYLAQCAKTTFIVTGTTLYFNKRKIGKSIKVGELPHKEIPLVLSIGDQLRLDKEPLLGEPAIANKTGDVMSKAHISCTAPEVFDQVKTGERIIFDDGKIEGVIKKINKESLLIKIINVSGGTAKLRAEKGINFPDSNLTLHGLTQKDKKDLVFIEKNADVVNFSFVNRVEDVQELFLELNKINPLNTLGIILKIETQNGFNHLADILLEAMQKHPIGVMIARGDLAIEAGWDNIGRVQEEILSLCQAAHVTDIWATQVLEGLAKKGIPSRSEITDTVMAVRSDCVMLNKGPFIMQAIRLLDTILTDMDHYWEKNAPMLPIMQRADIHSVL